MYPLELWVHFSPSLLAGLLLLLLYLPFTVYTFHTRSEFACFCYDLMIYLRQINKSNHYFFDRISSVNHEMHISEK